MENDVMLRLLGWYKAESVWFLGDYYWYKTHKDHLNMNGVSFEEACQIEGIANDKK